MITCKELARSVYLGDRACKRIIIDGWQRVLSVEVDRISRIRNPSGEWDYYTDEDIVDGLIVFDGVMSFTFEPQGLVPCDWIEILSMEEVPSPSGAGNRVHGVLSLGAVDDGGNAQEVILEVCATGLYLKDPSRPEARITE